MAAASNNLPPDIFEIGPSAKMIFLRDDPSGFSSRMHILPSDKTPPGVPLHWHEKHDEIFRVVKGRIIVRMGNKSRIYLPEDGEVRIPKGVLHSLNFFSDEECIFEEKTDPMDGEKEMFFRNLMEAEDGAERNIFKLALISYHGDMLPGLPWHLPWLEKVLVLILGGYLAPLLGYKLKHYPKEKRL